VGAVKAVIDSDVLIDYLQGIQVARAELERYRQPHYSIISWMELQCGAQNDAERAAVDTLLSTMTRVDLTETVARRAVELRQALQLKLPDAVVLSSAETEGCILVTRNTRDFPAGDPRLRFPYDLPHP
jgi:predicted nucleic acid-binding protein